MLSPILNSSAFAASKDDDNDNERRPSLGFDEEWSPVSCSGTTPHVNCPKDPPEDGFGRSMWSVEEGGGGGGDGDRGFGFIRKSCMATAESAALIVCRLPYQSVCGGCGGGGGGKLNISDKIPVES